MNCCTYDILFWPLDVGYMKIYLDVPDFYQSYFIFGMEIAPNEKMCRV